MKTRFTNVLGTGLVAAALMIAQTPQPAPGPQTPGVAAKGPHRRARLHRLVQLLNLSPDQKAQTKAIFQSGRASAQPLAAQMRDTRLALANAVKANAPDAEIDRLSNNAGALASQLTAIRTKTFAKLYTILTPEQKNKLNAAMGSFLKG